jgi:hypothetical protein
MKRIIVDVSTGSVTEQELTQAEIDEVLAQPQPPGPTPLEQIRAIEAAKADKTAKFMRQGMLLQTVTIAMARPDAQALTAGMTPEQAKAAVVSVLLATDPGFKLLYDLEQEIEPLRALVL